MILKIFRKVDQFSQKCRPYVSFGLALFVGILLLLASVSSWFKQPLGDVSSAWQIPVYVGWPLRLAALNYGLLCLLGMLLAFVAGGASIPGLSAKLPPQVSLVVKRRLKGFYRLVGIYSLVISLLFCLQYLLLDTHSIDQLAQNQVQSLLIAHHLGYRLRSPLLPIDPLNIDSNLFMVRLALLTDQVAFGFLVPVLAAIVMLRASRRVPVEPLAHTKSRFSRRWIGIALFVLIAVCLLGRVPIALFCESVASTALQGGDYPRASRWLDRAVAFDPAITDVASYHVQRGQIDYFVFHDTQGTDSQAYIAFMAYQRANYRIAYQDLFQIWQLHRTTQWITASFDQVMMRSIESKGPIKFGVDSNNFRVSVKEDYSSLPYVQELLLVDPSSVYGHYVMGRIDCDLQAYVACTHEMQQVIALATNKDIQSTAYTYIGLSEAYQGDYIASRAFLMKAVDLDPNYHNNTAREALSGLR